MIVPQAQASLGHSLLLLFTSTPRDLQNIIQQIVLSFSVLCKILNTCIDRLRADQLDAFKLASAPLPALLRDVKIVATTKRLFKILFNSMRMISGPQLVLGVEKQMASKLMMVMGKNRPLYANISTYKHLSTIFCQYRVYNTYCNTLS